MDVPAPPPLPLPPLPLLPSANTAARQDRAGRAHTHAMLRQIAGME